MSTTSLSESPAAGAAPEVPAVAGTVQGRSQRLHQSAIGAGTLAVALAMAWGASFIPSTAGYAGVGPNFLPWLVASALGLCGLWLWADARRPGGWREVQAPSGAAQGDWKALSWVVAGLAVNALLIERIGFILACMACYMLAVRGLRVAEAKSQGGARGLALDAGTGFVIAGPAFWLFTKLLRINLPGLTGTGWL